MAGACPTTKEGGAKIKKAQLEDGLAGSPVSSSRTPTSAATGSPADDGQGAMMTELLGEANKMLRGLGGGPPGGAVQGGAEDKVAKAKGTRARLEELQAELRQLQKEASTSLKVLRIARVRVSDRGLLDSGATHAMRGIPMGFNEYGNEKVTGGGETTMWLTPQGTLIHPDEEVEPIVPVGKLVSDLGCTFRWNGDDCSLEHPLRGQIEVKVVNACPEVSREDALLLIEDLESPKDHKAIKEALGTKRQSELMFLDRLLENHPAFEEVPVYLKDRIVDFPATSWDGLLLNRRLRKRIKNQGCIVHLYAGKDEGFTLTKAMKECGGDTTRLLEFDLLRDPDHDMVAKGGLFSTLLRLALDGCVDAVVGGPNCRTRSVLRYFDRPGYPKPCRSTTYPWGYNDLSDDERKKVNDDDVMMFRMMLLYVVAQMTRDALLSDRSAKRLGKKTAVAFLLEQPQSPEDYSRCASIWRTHEWQEFRYAHHMWEYHFMQGDWGGVARKPTTLGTNLYLEMPDPSTRGGLARGQGEEMDSKDLARWAPGMMREIAKSLTLTVQDKTLAICKLSWADHIENGHVPFRRDCAVCQRAAARMRPHYRQDCPEGYTLALDTAGPFCVGRDVDNKKKRYLLCGAYTWPTLGDVAEDDDLPKDPIPEKELVIDDPEYMDYDSDEEMYVPSIAGDDDPPAGGGDAALGDEKCSPGADSRGSDEVTGEVEDSESPRRVGRKASGSDPKSSSEEDPGEEKLTDEELGKRALDLLLEESPPLAGPARATPSTPSEDITGDEKELPVGSGYPTVDADGNPLPGLWGDPGPVPEPVEKKKKPKEDKTFKTRTIMQCVPMKSKKAEDVLAAIEELYMRFRRYGYPIFRLHTDSGKEFVNSKVKDWAANRGLLHTRSAPDEHQSNGRAEAAVNSIKSRVRRLLHGSSMGTDLWPLAARHVVELERRRFEKAVQKMPRFGERVVIRRRGWKTMFEDDFEPRGEEVTYLTPMMEVSKGHCVMTESGKLQVVSTVWNNLSEEPEEEKRDWIGEEVDPEAQDPVLVRRRLREKTSMAAMTVPEADGLEKQMQVCRVLHEEEEHMKSDDP